MLLAGFLTACSASGTADRQIPPNASTKSIRADEKKEEEKPAISPLQAEILNEENSQTDSPIGSFDFKNSTFPLPRGWEDIDSKEVTLENGVREMTEDKIGMAYVTTKYFDVTGDDKDEAFVILKVSTGSITIPQIVYIYEWKDDGPNLLWYFRTGDRSDGGLKKLGSEDGKLLVELFGRDRYIFSQMETGKIVGDEERLCCPTHFTRTLYRREGTGFVLDGDRWTFSLEDKEAEPEKNMNEVKLEEERGTKK
ncbi:MAG: hypothetical protein R2681_14930 [Pyrinomonadaceae bacterium]